MSSFTRALRRISRRVRATVFPPIDAYTTHLPVLIGLPRLQPVRRVLEFGCGPFSTLAFLNRNLYPDLTELVSYETDQGWLEIVKQRAAGDSRLKLVHVSEPMVATANGIDLEPFDLVFVDDSTTIGARAATIRSLVIRPFTHPLIVAHDMENPAYRQVVPEAVRRQEFDAHRPHTWVMWSGDHAAATRLGELATAIRTYATRTRPERIDRWVSYFRTALRS